MAEISVNKIAQEANLRNGVKRLASCSVQADKVKRISRLLKSVKESAIEMDKAINWEGYGLALGGAFITIGQVAWGVIDVVHEVGPKNVKVVTGIAKSLKPMAETAGDALAGKKVDALTLADRTIGAVSGAIGVRHSLGGAGGKLKAVSEGAKNVKGAMDQSIAGHKIFGRAVMVEMDAKAKGRRNYEDHYKSLKEAADLAASLKSDTKAGGKIKGVIAALDAAKNVYQWANITYESTTDSFASRARERKMMANDIRKLQRVLDRLMQNLDECLNPIEAEPTGPHLV